MNTFTRFLYEFLNKFFSGIGMVFQGIWNGIKAIFNIPEYIHIINEYKQDLSISEWLLVGIAIACIIVIVALVIFLIYLFIKKYMKITKKAVDQEKLMTEIADLNDRVVHLVKEKEEIMAMKVSQLGLKPGESSKIGNASATQGDEPTEEDYDGIRFPKLCAVDEEYANYKIKNYGNDFTLEELCNNFRNFAASQLKLYYDINLIRLFISALASTKMVILQGISGTGKTSLAYAWGKFVNKDSCVASVQPSWKDRTELFGYFNEFTKKFGETELLKELYEAGYTDDVHTVILDEMNISRVEYYFAEMLSILEMPNPNEWIVELVPTKWRNDPKKIIEGKLQIPRNTWYIGTINNDDSTFIVTDKVYDRAMPIDINDKGRAFKAEDTDSMSINFSYLNELFSNAMEENSVSDEILDKIDLMDNYVIKHFKIAFGNRIVAHMKKFVPVYVECGGTEVTGVDYFMAKKVLRKFEQLNIAYIKNELDPFIEFLNKTFGKGKMKECIEYITNLKKLT